MAGLLAVGAVSARFRSVTVVERDPLPDNAIYRKGVPQGRHLHSFLSRGPQVLDELFPGLLDELADAGAVVIDDDSLSRVYARIGHHEFNQSGRLADPSALRLYLGSRPFIERHVRRRVRTIDNVSFLDGHDMLEPVVTADSVSGVRIRNRNDGVESVLQCDLLIDARGRTARLPAFLDELGYGMPAEETCPSDWAYSSQLMTLPQPGFVERLLIANNGNHKPRVLLVAYEHGRWMLAVGRSGRFGAPPSDFAGMLASVADAFPERIASGLHGAQPVGGVSIFRKTDSVWRRFDQMTRFPAGYLVTGDALCSLNPLYGQGMTMAALEALVLRDCLTAGRDALWQRFFSAAAVHISPTWARNRANDHVPLTTERPKLDQRLQKWFVTSALIAAHSDVRVAEQLLRVNNLVDPPATLRDPALLLRVVAGRVRARPQVRPFRGAHPWIRRIRVRRSTAPDGGTR
ncbi:NAD(P)/FAD-dependent oxidoreductase [Mycobacterium sp. LTG2003]